VTAAPLVAARLFFRGFSRRVRGRRKDPMSFSTTTRSPVPLGRHGRLYTRFGDVRDLLTSADDRFVVMKSGDCVRLEFDAGGLPQLPPGWSRDWVVVPDGWEKDADKNTVAGSTVEPSPPHHGLDGARYGSRAGLRTTPRAGASETYGRGRGPGVPRRDPPTSPPGTGRP
jgi:hypothetical protein